jgi:hypothetical protein
MPCLVDTGGSASTAWQAETVWKPYGVQMMYAVIYHMKRTTIFVPEALERDLQLCAERDGKPVAALFREAVAAYLAGRRSATGLPSFAGAFDSGRADTAERHEEMVFRDLMPHGGAPDLRATRASTTRPRRARRR